MTLWLLLTTGAHMRQYVEIEHHIQETTWANMAKGLISNTKEATVTPQAQDSDQDFEFESLTFLCIPCDLAALNSHFQKEVNSIEEIQAATIN